MADCDTPKPETRVGDVDTAFVFKIVDTSAVGYDPGVDCDAPALDVSTATSMQMTFEKPDGTVSTQVAVFDTTTGATGDGTDGRIMFRAPVGFLDQAGEWRRQAIVVLPPGTWHSTIVCFTVHKNLV